MIGSYNKSNIVIAHNMQHEVVVVIRLKLGIIVAALETISNIDGGVEHLLEHCDVIRKSQFSV